MEEIKFFKKLRMDFHELLGVFSLNSISIYEFSKN